MKVVTWSCISLMFVFAFFIDLTEEGGAVAPTQLGDTCASTAECTAVISGSSECSSTTCSCTSGFTASGTNVCVQSKASVTTAANLVTLLVPATVVALRWT